MALEHDFFGLLESGPDGSVYWSETIELGDQAVSVDLTAPDQDDITPDALDAAAAIVASIEELDRRARIAMLGEVDNRASEVTEYILMMQDRLGDDLENFLVDVSGDAPVDIIRSLNLTSVTILADEHGGSDPFAVFEYALDRDEEDDVLLVNLLGDGEIQSVTSAD